MVLYQPLNLEIVGFFVAQNQNMIPWKGTL